MSHRLIELVSRLAGVRVALVGDLMLDRYIFGRTERISPEAPIPVLKFSREEHRLGGAGFVAAAMATLGGRVSVSGAVGQDTAGHTVRERLNSMGIDCDGLVGCANRPTCDKVRFLGSSEDRSPQQLLRLDTEETCAIDSDTSQHIVNTIRNQLGQIDVLALEDYNKGVLSSELTQQLIAMAREAGKPVVIDPARLDDYKKYTGATLLKLNRPEVERATGLKMRSPDDWPIAADKLLTMLDLEAIVITLNDIGSYLKLRNEPGSLLTSRPRQVADATGAGDTVLATIALACGAQASWRDAVALANVVAGLEVEKLGCVPIKPDEVVHDLLSEATGEFGKERTLETLLPELSRHRSAGRRIVFTNGCFDLIHLGHVKYFQFAKAQGDILVVGVNTDASISRLKGPKRPVMNEDDRVGVLEELESIDYLVRFDSDTPLGLIKAIEPDVLVKGADYRKEQVVGWDLVEARGGNVALAPLIDGRSTSNVISRILDAYSENGSG
ncbi:MAG TPA: D-glycero-beta-D-manno-heptose 1-phosphate adenylyltransferase [Tepidisphaeraceae bacterium]|nr:D-glycero-beta-D-manno-heptose 1-phosphate adenylyltransferase [Tepidisphaeraceae bacterium]